MRPVQKGMLSSLCTKLEMLIAEDAYHERTLQMGALRSISSEKEYAIAVKQILPVYAALEEALDVQVKAASLDASELQEYSSGSGAAAEVWREFGDRLRRESILKEYVTKRGTFAVDLLKDLELLPPASRQYIRRIRAAATLDGDLLLGHLFIRYSLIDLRFSPRYTEPWAEALQFPPLSSLGGTQIRKEKNDLLESLSHAIDRQFLDEDKQTAIIIEAQRACELNAKLYTERKGLFVGAVRGAFKLSFALIKQRLASTSSNDNREKTATFPGTPSHPPDTKVNIDEKNSVSSSNSTAENQQQQKEATSTRRSALHLEHESETKNKKKKINMNTPMMKKKGKKKRK